MYYKVTISIVRNEFFRDINTIFLMKIILRKHTTLFRIFENQPLKVLDTTTYKTLSNKSIEFRSYNQMFSNMNWLKQ